MSARWTTLVDAATLVAATDALVLDCRFDLADGAAGRRAYLAGHLPGARYLDLEEDMSARPNGRNGRHPLPDRTGLAARLAGFGLNGDTQVVAYDDAGGAFAARAWWLLRWLGHEAVAVLDGGIAAWLEAGLPLATGEPTPLPAGDFAASALPDMATIDAAAIEASLADHSIAIVDARTAARFRGEPHPLDPVAGHIPGARSRWFGDNLDAQGRFKPQEQLAEEYRALLGAVPTTEVAVSCGSGVTAAHDILALTHAGMAGARLYPGSWSEWISDPRRPVARRP